MVRDGEEFRRTVTMPGGEVYTSLERGTIDATEWGTLSINVPMGLHKIAKYIIIPGVHQPMVVWELLINKKVWDKLEKRDQALIESAEVSDVRELDIHWA